MEPDLLRQLVEIMESTRKASWLAAWSAVAAILLSVVAITIALFL